MKRSKIGAMVAVMSLILALWASSAMALSFDITGYTNSLWVIDPISGALVNDASGAGVGQTGLYTLSFSGGTGNLANASGLKGILSIAADDGTTYNSGTMVDTFAITNAAGVFTLSSLETGALLQLGLGALPLDPNFTSVLAAPAFFNMTPTGAHVYVNQVYGGFADPVGSANGPYSYDVNGLPTSPVIAYGSILADAFAATDANGNLIDLVIADANVPVPEPSTFLLIGAGLAGLAFYRRRQTV